MRFGLSSLVGGLALGSHLDDVHFLDFVDKYSKYYSSTFVRKARYSTFQENLEFINEFNRKNSDVQLGVNQFADMTNEDFVKHLQGPNPKPIDLAALKRGERIKYEENKLDFSSEGVDWTEKGAVTRVKDQGMCGSCWAFSTTGALEGLYAIKTGHLREFSEQQFVDCAGIEEFVFGCDGGLMDPGFHYAKKHGVCLEGSYPYHAEDQLCHLGQIVTKPHHAPNQCQIAIPPEEVTGFYDIPEDSVKGLKEALDHQPVSVAISAGSRVFQFYQSGVLDTDRCEFELNHGVLAVGYGKTKSGKAYWKVKNSWGSDWGNDGFILLAQDVADPRGQCGILQNASVPKFQKGAFDDHPTVGPPMEDESSTTAEDTIRMNLEF